MKNSVFIFLLFNVFSVFSQENIELPDVNAKVLEYCKKSMGKKVGRGECWDLAKFALDYAQAKWEPPYNYGEVVNPKTTQILAGDIIQFEKVKTTDGTVYPHHTAIVFEVLGKDNFLIVHQNIDNVKKVMTTKLDLSQVKKGSIDFYRPK